MTTADILGRFLWHDLMTTDQGAAGAFYPKVLGWTSEAWGDNSSYQVWKTPKGHGGGSSQLEADAGTPPHWLAYVGTPDIEGSLDKAKDLGASVVKEVESIPSVGKFAVLSDPQGAVFALYSPETSEAASTGTEYTWHELSTSDPEAAWDFYSELFGWTKEASHDMGPMGEYLIFGQDGKQIGGIFKTPPDRPASSNWLSYVSVDSAEQAAEAAKDAGGQVLNGPMEVPGGDLVAQLIDPQGAFFAVHQLRQAVAKAKKSKKPKREVAELAPVDATETAPAKKSASAKKSGGKANSGAQPAAASPPAGAKKKAKSKAKAAVKAKAPVKSKAAAKSKAGAKSKAAPSKAAAKSKAPARKAVAKKAAKKAVAKKGKKSAAPKKKAAVKTKSAKKKAPARKK